MAVPVDVERILSELAEMPAHLESAARTMDDRRARTPPADGGFSLVEQAWHLADLEREGYGERIRRLLAESEPSLPDFDGARIAAERNYRAKSLAEGIAAFSAARAANLAALGAVPETAWDRAGRQEGVGRVTLRDIPRMMREHDLSHRDEIAALRAGTAAPPSAWA
jgi:DinB family protein